MADTVRPGKVDWTGDNPFIYLKTDPEEDWSTLALFFRVTASDYGAGHLTLVVEDPYGPADSDARRVAFTDNVPLARFLIDEFVRRFVLFRPSTVLDTVETVDGATFTCDRDDHGSWVESCAAGDRAVELRWNEPGEPFAVDQPPHETGTGHHEMFSVFRVAGSAVVMIDGDELPGSTVERSFLNGPGQSAALALSETWVRA